MYFSHHNIVLIIASLLFPHSSAPAPHHESRLPLSIVHERLFLRITFHLRKKTRAPQVLFTSSTPSWHARGRPLSAHPHTPTRVCWAAPAIPKKFSLQTARTPPGASCEGNGNRRFKNSIEIVGQKYLYVNFQATFFAKPNSIKFTKSSIPKPNR